MVSIRNLKKNLDVVAFEGAEVDTLFEIVRRMNKGFKPNHPQRKFLKKKGLSYKK